MPMFVGEKLGAYEILGPLGAGGMGEVYRARDTRLDREVAVKVLAQHSLKDADAIARFEREAKAIAALSHPNVLAVHDFGREGDTPFVVTELLEGQTLRECLQNEALPLRKALEFAIAMADGLAAAHAKGIVHRDLKPANVFLTRGGMLKILDFGLARQGGAMSAPQDSSTPTITLHTSPGTVLGTLNYMSPEQLRGQQVDARSDIFAFGCVLYEMVTGRQAFGGDTSADCMTAILREVPETARMLRPEVGADLQRVIERCLDKNPDHRFHSSNDLAFTLRSILTDTTAYRARRADQGSRAFAFGVGTAALILLLAIGAASIYRSWPEGTSSSNSVASLPSGTRADRSGLPADPSSAPREPVRIAVLPFRDHSPDPKPWFSKGMTDHVNFSLAQISGLWVPAYPSIRKYDDPEVPLPKIGEELGVTHIVQGSITRGGERLQIRLELREAASQRQIWSDSFERPEEDPLGLQNEVARAIAAAVKVTLTAQDEARLAPPPKVNAQAFEKYLQGLSYVHQGTREALHAGLKQFQGALRIDPDFAWGHLGVAIAFNQLSNNFVAPHDSQPQVKAAADRAIELDPNLAEAYAMRGYYEMVYAHNWDAAQGAFEESLDLNPSSTEARVGYAMYLCAMKRVEEAMRQIDLVNERDPQAKFQNVDYGWVPVMAHKYDRAIRDAEEVLKINPDWWAAHLWAGMAYSQKGDHEDAVYHIQLAMKITQSGGHHAMAGGVIAVAGAKSEDPVKRALYTEEAKRIYRELKDREPEEYICPYELATIPLGLGDFDTTFVEMDRACEARADCLAWLQVDPRLDPIRDDARFDRLLEKVGFEAPKRLRVDKPASPTVKLAILPFDDRSGDANARYLADEIPASIIDSLATLSTVQTVPRSTTFRYRDQWDNVVSLGRQIGADIILTGQVNALQGGLRIRAELVDIQADRQLWSDHYDRPLSDTLVVEQEITEQLVSALKLQLSMDDRTRLKKRLPVESAAHRAYLRGRHLWHQRTPEALDKAIDAFDEAIRIDPNYALGYSGKADCYGMLAFYARKPLETLPPAKAAAQRALELDDDLAEAHTSMAMIMMMLDWDWSGAKAHLERAIALNSRYATAFQGYSLLCGVTGKQEESRQAAMKARELEPDFPIFSVNAAIALRPFDLELAIELHRKSVESFPEFAVAHVHLGYALEAKGMYNEALTEFESANALGGDMPVYAANLGYVYARTGRRNEALRELTRLTSLAESQYVPTGVFAELHAGLGDRAEALQWLEQAVNNREIVAIRLRQHNRFDELRDDPRFEALMGQMGLRANVEP